MFKPIDNIMYPVYIYVESVRCPVTGMYVMMMGYSGASLGEKWGRKAPFFFYTHISLKWKLFLPVQIASFADFITDPRPASC